MLTINSWYRERHRPFSLPEPPRWVLSKWSTADIWCQITSEQHWCYCQKQGNYFLQAVLWWWNTQTFLTHIVNIYSRCLKKRAHEFCLGLEIICEIIGSLLSRCNSKHFCMKEYQGSTRSHRTWESHSVQSMILKRR